MFLCAEREFDFKHGSRSVNSRRMILLSKLARQEMIFLIEVLHASGTWEILFGGLGCFLPRDRHLPFSSSLLLSQFLIVNVPLTPSPVISY